MTWKIVKLGQICHLQNGFAFKSRYFKDKGLPILRISNIQNERIDTRRPVYFDVKDYKEDLKKYEVKNGDLLIAMSGATTGKIGFNETQTTFYLNQRVGKLVPNKNLDKKYLYYLLSTKVEENLRISKGTAQPNLSSEQIKNIDINLPPLTEQQSIVAKLDIIFEDINKSILFKKRQVGEFNSLKLSIFKNMLDGPKVKLGDLYEITSSKRVFKSEWKRKGVPFYRAREIVKLSNNKPFNNPIYISEEMFKLYSKKYGAPKEGDILITGVGTLGVTYLVKKNDKFYFKDGNIIWLKKKQNNINSNYIEAVFNSPFVKSQVTNSIGATVGTLTIQKAKELSIPYPSMQVQNKIMEKMKKIFVYMIDYENKVKKNIQNYTTLKNSVLKHNLQNKSS